MKLLSDKDRRIKKNPYQRIQRLSINTSTVQPEWRRKQDGLQTQRYHHQEPMGVTYQLRASVKAQSRAYVEIHSQKLLTPGMPATTADLSSSHTNTMKGCYDISSKNTADKVDQTIFEVRTHLEGSGLSTKGKVAYFNK